MYDEKGPGRHRQRGSSRQKVARRSVVPRLEMKGNQQPPPKRLLFFASCFSCSSFCVPHLQSLQFLHSLTLAIMSYRLKPCLAVNRCLLIIVYGCVCSVMPHGCLTEANAIVYPGSCLHAWLSLSAVDAETSEMFLESC